MTTEREYQEGQRRIRKVRRKRPKKNNQLLWIFLGIIVFVGLIMVHSSRNRSPQTLPSNSNQVSL